MRKIYIAIISLAVAIPASSHTHKLTGWKATDGLEQKVYNYDDQNRLIHTDHLDADEPEYRNATVVTYDENGREIRSDLYQDYFMTGTGQYKDYLHVAYVDYTYDDKGRLYERRNYNNNAAIQGGEDFQLVGIMEWIYDENGDNTLVNTYFDPTKSKIFMQLRNSYSVDGKLIKDEQYMDNFAGGMDILSGTEYTYDEQGRISKKQYLSADYYNGGVVEAGYDLYTYTPSGSLSSVDKHNYDGSTQERKDFLYEDEPLKGEDIVLPYENDEAEDNLIYSLMTEMPYAYDLYAVNINNNELTKVATMEYNLEALEQDAIEGIKTSLKDGFAVTLAPGGLKLQGVKEGAQVRIYSLNGQLVNSVRYNGVLSTSGLNAGSYIVVTPAGAAKIVK